MLGHQFEQGLHSLRRQDHQGPVSVSRQAGRQAGRQGQGTVLSVVMLLAL